MRCPPRSTVDRADVFRNRSLPEQLRGELVQVLLPVGPDMPAARLLELRVVPELLQQGDRLLRPVKQEVVLAGGEPQNLQPVFSLFGRQSVLVRFLPLVPSGEYART